MGPNTGYKPIALEKGMMGCILYPGPFFFFFLDIDRLLSQIKIDRIRILIHIIYLQLAYSDSLLFSDCIYMTTCGRGRGGGIMHKQVGSGGSRGEHQGHPPGPLLFV